MDQLALKIWSGHWRSSEMSQHPGKALLNQTDHGLKWNNYSSDDGTLAGNFLETTSAPRKEASLIIDMMIVFPSAPHPK